MDKELYELLQDEANRTILQNTLINSVENN